VSKDRDTPPWHQESCTRVCEHERSMPKNREELHNILTPCIGLKLQKQNRQEPHAEKKVITLILSTSDYRQNNDGKQGIEQS
jgi:hypothetical protein